MVKYLVLAAGVVALAAPALAQQGGFTPPTPEERAANFIKADANKDNKLDQAEFKISLGERAAQMPAEMLPQIFGRRDGDKDGFISKAEYDAPMQRPGGGGN